jgi:hypothetical protein
MYPTGEIDFCGWLGEVLFRWLVVWGPSHQALPVQVEFAVALRPYTYLDFTEGNPFRNLSKPAWRPCWFRSVPPALTVRPNRLSGKDVILNTWYDLIHNMDSYLITNLYQ